MLFLYILDWLADKGSAAAAWDTSVGILHLHDAFPKTYKPSLVTYAGYQALASQQHFIA